MVPAAVLIAFLLLGVEEIGVQIEEPFGILPLGVLTGLHTVLETPASLPCAVGVHIMFRV